MAFKMTVKSCRFLRSNILGVTIFNDKDVNELLGAACEELHIKPHLYVNVLKPLNLRVQGQSNQPELVC